MYRYLVNRVSLTTHIIYFKLISLRYEIEKKKRKTKNEKVEEDFGKNCLFLVKFF